MASIFDSLKGLITPDIISSASSALGEDSSSVTKAVTSAIPTLLGSILAKGNDPGVESALKQAGSSNSGILSNLAGIFSGDSDSQTQGIGSGILNAILGNKLGGVASLISSISGISGSSSNKLLSMLGPVVGGFLGNKMSTEGLNLSGLLGKLSSEKSSFLGDIPSGLSSILGVASFANLGNTITSKAKGVTEGISDVVGAVNKPKSGLISKLIWAAIALLAVILGLFAWRSCKEKAVDKATTVVETTVAGVTEMKDNVVESVKSLADFTLPDGTKIQGLNDGIESQLVKYLESNEYKNATADQLKDKWFNFNSIDFEFGSGTQLTAGSDQQINNLVAILKNYKNAKVKLGAYTDNKGDSAANLKLSQERANTIKRIFTEKGVGSQVSGAEGYGDKFATVDASASDEARAIDRRVALRFDK